LAYRRIGVWRKVRILDQIELAYKVGKVEIAFRHRYLKQEAFNELDDAYDKILGQIVKMIDHADDWVIKSRGGASGI
jgi:hypothetical protein